MAPRTPAIVGCLVKAIQLTFLYVSTLHDLSRRMRQLRLRHGLTQEQFAELAGMSYKFYQQIERGCKKQIWLETVERLAAPFGLEAWQLLAPEEPPMTVIPRMRRSMQSSTRPVRAVAEDRQPYGRPRKTGKSGKGEKGGRGGSKVRPK